MKTTIKVAALISNSKDEILLIQEKYYEKDGLKWNLVKGTFDNINETLIQCVEREIREEANIGVENTKLDQIFQYGDDNHLKILFVFSADVLKNDEKKLSFKNQKNDENIVQVKWFTKEQVANFSKDDFIAPYVYESLINFLQDTTCNVAIQKLN